MAWTTTIHELGMLSLPLEFRSVCCPHLVDDLYSEREKESMWFYAVVVLHNSHFCR